MKINTLKLTVVVLSCMTGLAILFGIAAMSIALYKEQWMSSTLGAAPYFWIGIVALVLAVATGNIAYELNCFVRKCAAKEKKRKG